MQTQTQTQTSSPTAEKVFPGSEAPENTFMHYIAGAIITDKDGANIIFEEVSDCEYEAKHNLNKRLKSLSDPKSYRVYVCAVMLNGKRTGRYFEDENKSFVMTGDSMDNGKRDSVILGDVLNCHMIERNNWLKEIHNSKGTFAVVLDEGTFIGKLSVAKDVVTCRVLNPKYGSAKIKVDQIKGLYRIYSISRQVADLGELELIYPAYPNQPEYL